MEDETFDSFKNIVNFIVLGIVIVCLIGGIILNVLFIRNNKGFTKEKEKLSDVKFFFSLLAIFNILYLIDIIPFSIYLINSGISRQLQVFCRMYNYYSQITMFGMFYCVITCCRDCFILSQNNPKYKYSNRLQTILEALTVWAVFLTFFFVIEINLNISIHCFKTNLAVLSEIVAFLISIISLIFTSLTYCKARQLNLQDSLTMHIILQTRKICILYFLFWFPTIFMNVFTGHLIFYDNKAHFFNRETYFFRIFSYALEYSAAALFPLLCKIKKDGTVEHELM